VPKQKIERVLERGLFASRWLMAPFYVGLVLALVALLVTFAKEIFHVFSSISTMGASDVILASLSLIDLSLAGNLLLIVIFSGYESFVSKIDIADHEDQFEWKGKVDFAAMKLKLIASIVAISGIHLLKVFMDVDKYPDDQIRWMVVIHIVFVISGLMLALMDRVAYGAKKH
jgi:uncharacterized protein (TIGR00645 family)